MRVNLAGVPLAITCLGLLSLLAQIALFWPFTVDDAFITFRYSQNLAHGYGPVFNAAGPPVEGYTSFLWVLLMALPELGNLGPVLFSKLLSLLATGACIAITIRFAYRLTTQPRYGEGQAPALSLLFLLFATFPATSIHAVAGMETATATALLTGFFYATHLAAENLTNKRAIMVGVLALLCGLVRPEFNLSAVLAIGVLSAILPRGSRLALLRWVGLLYVLPGAIYFIWRFAYYGLLFPLPFYVKVASQSLLSGLPSIEVFVARLVLPLGVLVAVGLLATRRTLLPTLVGAGTLFVFFFFPQPIMDYDWRYLFPIVPVLFLLSALGISTLLQATAPVAQEARGRVSTLFGRLLGDRQGYLCIALAMLIAALSLSQFQGTWRAKISYAKGLNSAHVALGKKLAALRNSTPTPLLIIDDAGAVPYYSGWRTIDSFGLNDAEVTLKNNHDPAAMLARGPDLVVLISYSRDQFEPYFTWDQGLYDGSLRKGMAVAGKLEFEDNYYLWLMAAPNSPVSKLLRGP